LTEVGVFRQLLCFSVSLRGAEAATRKWRTLIAMEVKAARR
jgi:hypothetical protein